MDGNIPYNPDDVAMINRVLDMIEASVKYQHGKHLAASSMKMLVHHCQPSYNPADEGDNSLPRGMIMFNTELIVGQIVPVAFVTFGLSNDPERKPFYLIVSKSRHRHEEPSDTTMVEYFRKTLANVAIFDDISAMVRKFI